MQAQSSQAAQAPLGVRADFDLPMTLRDGTMLRANVFRPVPMAAPDDGGQAASTTYPVLLMRLPYGKDFPLGSSTLNPVQVARRGYIVVVQDVRGTFTAEGDFFPFMHEGTDGADAVAWAAALPGANGVVGMYGASYMGFTQWAAAREQPSALKAIAPMITWADPDQGLTTRGGAYEVGTLANWTLQRGLDQLARRHRGDPLALAGAFAGLARELDGLPHAGYSESPLERFGPLARLGLDEAFTEGVRRAGDRAFTAPTRHTDDYARVNVPVLHIGGWYDVFLDGTIRNFNGMRAAGHPDQHLLLGPWSHGVFDHVVGEVDFGFAASAALMNLQTDLVSLHLAFFDRYLKGLPNDFARRAPVTYFVMGANVWRTGETWPPRAATPVEWYLRSAGHANSAAGDGVLSRERPEHESADTFVYDPTQPVPTIGGATLLHPLFKAGPRDQRPIEQRADMLVYTSAPLEQPLEVSGPVSVTLHVASDAPDTDFVARLVDASPDGTALPVTDGIQRLRYRNGGWDPAPPLQPDQPVAVTIDLWSTSQVFLPGHRLRLDVTSSSFPRWDRNPNTGEPIGTSTTLRPARQTLLHDAEHPSYVLLSIIPG
jgi:putative CocE/NonD family hydrolase